ncbi:MAG: apolipoprotein A1/A4/E family protein [Synergistaceae bacterium]|jgi:hypothetical protein|nr:apolipoprotein A1/A4/E family protein [Synergistaceae bacterium]
MSDLSRLDAELRSLQNQIRQGRSEMDRMRGDLKEDERRKLEEYHRELEKKLAARDRETTGRYETKLREFQDSTRRDVARARLEMDERYRELVKTVENAEREWERRSRALEDEARELRTKAADRERAGRDEATGMIEEAGRAYSRIGETPHSLFFPHRLGAFGGAIADAAELYKVGLFEASAAVSISARLGIERLGYDVMDKRYEWRELFSMLKARVGSLHLRLEGELLEWGRQSGSEARSVRDMSDEEKEFFKIDIDYWSRGVYMDLRRRVDRFGSMIAYVMKIGIDGFLKSDWAQSAGKIEEKIAEADEWSDRLDRLGRVHESRRDASIERGRWGEAIIDFLSGEINLTWLEGESGWKKADEETMETEAFKTYSMKYLGGEDEDVREWLALSFKNMAGSKVFIYIIPDERDGRVRNRVLTCVDHQSGGESTLGRDIYRHVLESLGKSEDEGVAVLVEDVAGLSASPDRSLRGAGLALKERLWANADLKPGMR